MRALFAAFSIEPQRKRLPRQVLRPGECYATCIRKCIGTDDGAKCKRCEAGNIRQIKSCACACSEAGEGIWY